MSAQPLDPTAVAATIDGLAIKLQDTPTIESLWVELESASKGLADSLRTKDGPEDIHTAAGKTSLPANLVVILKLADVKPENAATASAIYEQLRVGANLCMDHDVNRQYLLDAEYPQAVLALLDNYTQKDLTKLTLLDLKVIKTAIGVLLNTSLGFDPIRSLLTTMNAPVTVLKLTTALYTAGAWANQPTAEVDEWQWRSGLSSWAWRAIHEFSENVKESVFGPRCLPDLTRPFELFNRPYSASRNTLVENPQSRNALIEADIDVLEEVSSQLETLSLDHESIRMSLASNIATPEGTPLQSLLRFIEDGDYPPYWDEDGEAEKSKREKAFDIVKGAIIKVLIAVASEDKALPLMWQKTSQEGDNLPGGWFTTKMVKWVQEHADEAPGTGREDLVIAGTLTLGNLARQEDVCIAIVQPPIELVPHLCKLLEPSINIKVKHGALGLLKHLAQTPSNRSVLGDAGILEKIANSKVWDRITDMAEIVQVSAVGVAKHLSNSNLNNSLRLVEASGDSPSGTDQILDFVRRSDSVVVKSEGTRVLVNVVKSLWSSAPADAPPTLLTRRKAAIEKLTDIEPTRALARMIGRSKKYPVLLNEGIIALTLIATHPAGASHVLRAINEPLPAEVGSAGPPGARISESEAESSVPPPAPPPAPPIAGDMTNTILVNSEDQYPPELRANTCALLAILGRKVEGSKAGTDDYPEFKDAAIKSLKAIDGVKADVVRVAAEKALHVLSL